ncbi:hypothetical protein AcV7_002609 [Taiwanofungus camphoratus]|nr:hypothetical protein AcV7_002609 [Antrodia cinnamomea]
MQIIKPHHTFFVFRLWDSFFLAAHDPPATHRHALRRQLHNGPSRIYKCRPCNSLFFSIKKARSACSARWLGGRDTLGTFWIPGNPHPRLRAHAFRYLALPAVSGRCKAVLVTAPSSFSVLPASPATAERPPSVRPCAPHPRFQITPTVPRHRSRGHTSATVALDARSIASGEILWHPSGKPRWRC